MLKNRLDGTPSDLAWIQYESVHSANKSLELNGSVMMMNRLTVVMKDSTEGRNAVNEFNGTGLGMPMMMMMMPKSLDGRPPSMKYVRGSEIVQHE